MNPAPPTPHDHPRSTPAPGPILGAEGITRTYDGIIACRNISLDVWPGEVVAIVGESGSGKSTLLHCLAARQEPSAGTVRFRPEKAEPVDIHALPEAARRRLMRREWGIVHQNPRDGLRLYVTAGANIGEPLMALGERRYGSIRAQAYHWLEQVEIDTQRIDDLPLTFSGGMQQRLQIARVLATRPRLVYMDEPTGGLDVSVQARLLDLIRRLAAELDIAVLLVTHDLGVARLLAHRLIVMRRGEIVEQGLTDQVLDDPHHPYTQLLVSSVIQV
ncbi:MAG: phosphonate C-P lyase system protein PhnK [Deltaproteobacteria bacterium]|nr:phosphonate C-P lyase system protein PhnK [Candidatus Anaeroferrophillacea bacterium]